MEPITLITTALTLATPFLKKTGEAIAEGVGEDIWKWIKKPFSNSEEDEKIEALAKEDRLDELKDLLLQKINENNDYAKQLLIAVQEAQYRVEGENTQNINNNGTVEKQINIQNNSGTINF